MWQFLIKRSSVLPFIQITKKNFSEPFQMGIGENSAGLHLFNEFNVTSGSSSKEMVRAFGSVELTILQFFENFGFVMTSLI